MATSYENELLALKKRFAALVSPPDATYAVDQLAGPAFLAKASNGAPCIVFKLSEAPIASPALVSAGVEFVVHPQSMLSWAGKSASAALAVLISRDDKWREEFFVLVLDALSVAKKAPVPLTTMQGAREFFKRWSALFREVRPFTFEQRLGLWGELQVLKRITPIDAAVDVWHGPEAYTFDFGNNGVSIEVKSSTVADRHLFSLDQVAAPPGSKLLVASLHVRLDPAAGTTVGDEINEVLAKATAPLSFEEKILKLGLAQSDRGGERFSLVSMRFVNGQDVPQPRAIDPGVDLVSFRADVSDVDSATDANAKKLIDRLTSPAIVKKKKQAT